MNSDPSGSSIFHYLSETDDRKPMFTFSIPSSIDSLIMIDGIKTATTGSSRTEFGFLMLSFSFWIELLAMVFAMISIAAMVGLVLYHTVIKPKQEGTIQAYMVGWGIILPFWAAFSFFFLSVMDVRNMVFKFMTGCITILCFFRTTESIYGFAPEYVKGSASDFCFYYATVPIVARVKKRKTTPSQNKIKEDGGDAAKSDDNNIHRINNRNIGDPIPCSLAKTMKHLVRFTVLLFITGALQSILNPHRHFAIFGAGGSNEETLSWYATERYFTWELYANSALQALFLQSYLTTYLEGLIFAFALLTGYDTEPVMDNPLLKSQSPAEFWGRRWNLLVHTVLKNGVYKPVRKLFSSKTVAVLMTFLSSGIFHEWILLMMFASNGSSGHQNNSKENAIYQPNYGGTTVFFLWQALLIGLELTVGRSKLFQTISTIMPRPLKTAFIVGMGIPLAHFFLDPYVRSDFFRHGAPGLPMIVPIPK